MQVLNKCKTAMGSRLLTSWLKQPLLTTDEINERLNVVEALTESPQVCV
jgi:DNA mismatch repair ATPase MutS